MPILSTELNALLRIAVCAGFLGAAADLRAQTTPSTTCPSATADVGGFYSSQLVGSGGSGGYIWTLTSGSIAPLTLNAGGLISGTPTALGVLNFTVKITDSQAATTQTPCSINVTLAPSTTCPTAVATVGVFYFSTVIGLGGSGGFSWSLAAGSLAPLTLTPSGNISGTVTAAVVLNFILKVTDSSGATAQQLCSIIVTISPPPSTTCPAATAIVSSPYSSTVIPSNGTGVFSYSLAGGSLAPLTLNTGGLVSGTPAATGTLNFTLKVTDTSGTFALQTCTITISGSIVITSASISPNQTMLSASFPQPAPDIFAGTLTLSFTPDPGVTNVPAGYIDPAGGFPIGAASPTALVFNFRIPQGATQASAQFSRGTVAGTWTATLTALSDEGGSALPTPVPTQTVVVPRAAPVIDANSVKIINVTPTGLTVTLTGSVTSRNVSSAAFVFAPAAGATLTGTTVSVPFGGPGSNSMV